MFIPYKELSTAKDLAYIFLRWIVAEHALPRELVLDRDVTADRNTRRSDGSD